MAYAENREYRKVGPIRVYFQTFATPDADEDWNDASAMTELFVIDPDSPVEINQDEERIPIRSAAHLADIGEILVGQSLEINFEAQCFSLNNLAYALGLTSSSVEDKTGDDPTRIQLPFGGSRTTSYFNVIFKQEHPNISGKYNTLYVIKGTFKLSGPQPLKVDKETVLPILLKGFAPDSGTYAGVLAVQAEEYGSTTPAIDSITPSSGAVDDYVMIQGENFGSSRGSSVVTFHDAKEATVYPLWTDNAIYVKVPTGATTGNVTVTVNGVESSGESFTVS